MRRVALVMAWTTSKERAGTCPASPPFDDATWVHGRGLALWKSQVTLVERPASAGRAQLTASDGATALVRTSMPFWPSIPARGDPPARERVRVELRARTNDDLDACELLACEVHDVDGYPPRFADDLRRFVSASGALAAWVAVSDGAIVGHVALQPTSSPAVMVLAGEATGRAPARLGVVARLLVAPAYRRKGLGGALLGLAAQAAHDRGRWPVLDVATHFHAAIGLYERAGWVRAGRVEVRFRDAEPLAEYVYIGPTPGRGQP